MSSSESPSDRATEAYEQLCDAAAGARRTQQPSIYGSPPVEQVKTEDAPSRRPRTATVHVTDDGTAMPVTIVLSAADLVECGIDAESTDELVYWVRNGNIHFSAR